jgi:hypothetical protein
VPFTIEMQAPARERPELANVELSSALGRAFPAIVDFPLDHEKIARDLRVPRDQVLSHWPQLELHGDETVGRPIVTIWLQAAFIEITSTPPTSCEEWLIRIEPLLAFFRERGYTVPTVPELLPEYEAQRQRVKYVAGLVGGSPNG